MQHSHKIDNNGDNFAIGNLLDNRQRVAEAVTGVGASQKVHGNRDDFTDVSHKTQEDAEGFKNVSYRKRKYIRGTEENATIRAAT